MFKKVLIMIFLALNLLLLSGQQALNPDYELIENRDKIRGYWIVRGTSMLDRERARARMRSMMAMQIEGSLFIYDSESGEIKLINETTITGSISEPPVSLKGGKELYILATDADIEEVSGPGVTVKKVEKSSKEVDNLLREMIAEAVIAAAKESGLDYSTLRGKVYVSGFEVKYKRFRNIFQAKAEIRVIFLEGE